MSIIAESHKQYVGTSFGIMMACCAVGRITIPFLMGLAVDVFSIGKALWGVSIIMLIIANQVQILRNADTFV